MTKPPGPVGRARALFVRGGLDPTQRRRRVPRVAPRRRRALRRAGDGAARSAASWWSLDDVGAGHSNLDRIPLLRPDVIKIDRSLITGVDADFYKQETLKSLVSLSRRIGALVVAEAIETEAEAMTGARSRVPTCCSDSSSPAPSRCRPSTTAASIAPPAGSSPSRARSRVTWSATSTRASCSTVASTSSSTGSSPTSRTQRPPAFDPISARRSSRSTRRSTASTSWTTRACRSPRRFCDAGLPNAGRGAVPACARKDADHSLKEYFYVLIDVELQKYTTDPYVSLAGGQLCRTISTCFRDAVQNRTSRPAASTSAPDRLGPTDGRRCRRTWCRAPAPGR